MFIRIPNPFSPQQSGGDEALVEEVRPAQEHEPRSRRVERVLAVGWILIGLKCGAVWWLVPRYDLPFSAWWIIAPTLVSAAICTWLYVRR